MIRVELYDETKQVSQAMQDQLIDLLQFAAKYLGQTGKSSMEVTLIDNDSMQELNLSCRGKDEPTDVLSFEYPLDESRIMVSESDFEDHPELAEILTDLESVIGELFISVDKAKEQADRYGHSFEREMGFLVVHGFLHINGYDHCTPEDEAEMFGLQEEILTAYGLSR